MKSKSGLTRRTFLASTAAIGAARFGPNLLRAPATRRIVRLYYDKAVGAMRLIEKTIP